MHLNVGDEHISAKDRTDAIRIASRILLEGSQGERVFIYERRSIYGWLEIRSNVSNKKPYVVLFRRKVKLGNTILMPNFKLGHGQRWTKPRLTP